MFEIQNDLLKIVIAAKGAELQSVQNLAAGLEYMWSGDEKFWGKKSPVLFPIVGGLKNNSYTHEGKTYQLGRHGFARDRMFTAINHSKDSITFQLKSDAESLAVYPFDFIFSITYTLEADKLSCTYSIENPGDKVMYFSVGAHPAFKVPLTADTTFTDWHLKFNETEDAPRWPLSTEGLTLLQSEGCITNTNIVPLAKDLFSSDALVFKNLQSDTIVLASNKSIHGLSMEFRHFPYYGIWSTKNADFVCLEPWCGIADNVAATGELKDKEGINSIEPAAVFSRTWSVTFF
ncbi:MAG: aldose 1-epimerase family protein [Ferruginibacter sp.]